MALLPATLVLFSALLSGFYKLSYQFQLTNKQRRKITITHALAIESIQALILVIGVVVQYFQIAAVRRGDDFTCHGLIISSWNAIPTTIGIYIFALFAIDTIDNRFQLGSWPHPVQIQTLLLTRSITLPWTVKRKEHQRKQPPLATRPSSEPQPMSPSKPSGSPWSTSYLTPEPSPALMVSPRTHRSLSEPSTPKWLFLDDIPARRRDSMPMPGSMAKLVPTFEIATAPSEKPIPSLSTNINRDGCPAVEDVAQSSFDVSTPPSSAEKRSDGLPNTDTPSSSSERTVPSSEQLVLDGLSEASTAFTTPDTTPERTPSFLQPEVPIIKQENPKPAKTKTKPTTQRSDKKAAQHTTAARAQRRGTKDSVKQKFCETLPQKG